MSMKQGDAKTAFAAVATIDKATNSVINLDSAMTLLDNYIKDINNPKAKDGIVGVPVTYYLKKLKKSDISKFWDKHLHSR